MTIAECLKEVMLEQGAQRAWAGDPDLLLKAYAKAGGGIQHPLNRIKAVLDAARRSGLFVSDGYILAHDSSGRREVAHPAFKLAPSNQ